MRLRGRDLIKSWALPVLLAMVALAFDAADRRVPFTVLTGGALDEGAHLATGALTGRDRIERLPRTDLMPPRRHH
jgi:hypothetical protein